MEEKERKEARCPFSAQIPPVYIHFSISKYLKQIQVAKGNHHISASISPCFRLSLFHLVPVSECSCFSLFLFQITLHIQFLHLYLFLHQFLDQFLVTALVPGSVPCYCIRSCISSLFLHQYLFLHQFLNQYLVPAFVPASISTLLLHSDSIKPYYFPQICTQFPWANTYINPPLKGQTGQNNRFFPLLSTPPLLSTSIILLLGTEEAQQCRKQQATTFPLPRVCDLFSFCSAYISVTSCPFFVLPPV